MKRAAFFCLGTIVMVGACRDERTITKPAQPSFAISDGSNGGNKHFFFLPPIVSQPSFSGTFNAQLTPDVRICQLDANQNCVGGTFSPGPVQLNGSSQQYSVNWDTGLSPLVAGSVYRLTVSVAGQFLGFADVEPVSGSVGQFKNMKTGDVFVLQDGRTVPLKFRIELGAFGTNCATDCAEGSLTDNGGTVVTNTGFAGVQAPSGWLGGGSPVIVTIERVTTINEGTIDDAGSNRCIPLDVSVAPAQFEGCYRFKTVPTATFAQFVTVGVCIPVTVPEADLDAIQLFSVEEPVGEVPIIRQLQNVPAPFVSCPGFTSTPLSTGLLRRLPGQLLQHLVRLVTPKRAYAFHLGAGGSTCCFSRIGWALPASTPVNFDVGPSGTISPGSVVNRAYANLGVINDVTVGVTFSRTTPGGFCGDANVYANDNGPLAGGGFGFESGNNVVTICPENTASDFSENLGGRIVASFTGTVTQVCIQVYATGFQSDAGKLPGATGFLEAFDASGLLSLGKTTSDPNAFGQNICVNSTANANIASVQFAGSGSGFAEFDNMTVRFAQAPPPTLPD